MPTPSIPRPAITPAHEAFIRQWLPLVLSTIAVAPGTDPTPARQSSLTLIDFLRPRDPAEAVITGLCVATLFSGMESLRQSLQPGLPPHLACRLRGNGFSAVRMVLAMVRKLAQGRGEDETSFLPDLPELTTLLHAQAAQPHPAAPPTEAAPQPPAASPPPPQPTPANTSAIAPCRLNPMPSENTPSASIGAMLASLAPDQKQPELTRRQRKAARYAMARALRQAAA